MNDENTDAPADDGGTTPQYRPNPGLVTKSLTFNTDVQERDANPQGADSDGDAQE